MYPAQFKEIALKKLAEDLKAAQTDGRDQTPLQGRLRQHH